MAKYGPKPATHCKDCGDALTPENRGRDRSAKCRPCFLRWQREYAAEWRRKNPKKVERAYKKRRRGAPLKDWLHCIKCGCILIWGENYNPETASSRGRVCRECTNGKLREWVDRNRERARWGANRYKWELKVDAIQAYGGACACCGETMHEFLSIDHIYNDGAEERRDSREWIYKSLKERGWPKDRYQLLCMNCNTAKGFYGYCPHQEGTKTFEERYGKQPEITPQVENGVATNVLTSL